jgi:hypothetical protein
MILHNRENAIHMENFGEVHRETNTINDHTTSIITSTLASRIEFEFEFRISDHLAF